MKSFGKTFRTFLAMSLVLCMVMSCVTVSADNTVTLSDPTIVGRNNEGYYEVQYTVSGISEGGSATILVYDEGESISNSTIKYANQATVEVAEGASEGSATFTMLLDNGKYDVLAGGTGFALANETGSVTTGTAPEVTVTPVTPNINDKAVAETKVADFRVDDVDGIANVETIALSGTGYENFAVVWTKGEAEGTIVVAENVELTPATYSELVLTATDAEEKAGTKTFAITVDPSITTLNVIQPEAFTVAYGTTFEDAVKDIKLTTQEGVEVSANWTAPEGYNNGTVTGPHTFTGKVANPDTDLYVLFSDSVSVVITVDTAKVSAFAELDGYEAVYGKDETDVAEALLAKYPKVEAKYDNDKTTNVEVTAWNTEDYNPTAEGGKFTFTAEYKLPVGFELLNEEVAAPTVVVTVGKNPTTYIDKITVDSSAIEEFGYGTTKNDITTALAEKVTAIGNGNEDIALTLTDWDSADFVEGEYKEFTFTATAEAPEGDYTFRCNTTVEVKVTVKDNRTIVTVDEYTNSFPIGYNGTYYEPVIKLLDKDNNDVTNDAANITAWAIVGDNQYDPKVAGTYTFKATITLNDGYKFVEDEVITTSKDVYYTVTVTDGRPTITDIEYNNADIEVKYGTEQKDIKFPTVTFVDCDEDVQLGEWVAAPDYDATTPGEYTFTAEVLNTSNNNYIFAVEENVTVKVIVGSNVYVMTEGVVTLGDEAAYAVSGFDKAMDAVYVTGGTLTIKGGTYDGGTTPYGGLGNTAVYAYGEGTRVVIEGGHFSIKGLPQKDGKYDEGHIDLIYAKEGAVIEISDGTFDASGDYVWGVNVHDKNPGTIIITGGTFIGWDPANPGFVGLDKDGNKFVGKEEIYLADGYTTELIEENTWKVVPKKEVNTITPFVVYLLNGHTDDYQETLDAMLEAGIVKNSLTVTVDGVDYEITDIKWPELDEVGDYAENFDGNEWPKSTSEDNPVVVKAKSFTLPEALKAGEATPEIRFTVIPSTFDFAVNGISSNQVITKKGDKITLEITYDTSKIEDVKYYYAITDNGVAPTEWEEDADGVIELNELVEGEESGISKRVSAKVVAGGYELAVKRAYVYRSDSLINGSIYLASEGLWPKDDDTYSAFRVNRNRPLEVKVDLNAKNGATRDFATGIAEARIDETDISVTGQLDSEGAGILKFAAEDISSITTDGAYKIVFTYKEADATEPEFEISRTTHITDRTLWYTEMSIDGANHSGVRISKNLPFNYVLKIDTPDKVYAGYKFVSFGEEFTDDGVVLTEEPVEEYVVKVDTSEIPEVGTYSLYGLANLTNVQDFFDFKFARTVYVKNSITDTFRIYFNDNTATWPRSDNGTLNIRPAIGNINGLEESRNYTFDLTLYSGKSVDDMVESNIVDLSSFTTSGGDKAGKIITGADIREGITIEKAGSMPDYMIAEINVYVNGEKDAYVSKSFHVKNIADIAE